MTTTYEMGKDFVKENNLEDYVAEVVDKMICCEANDSIADGQYKGQRNQWTHATADAFERIKTWWKEAHDYRIKSVADFVATHRRACVWTVLFARETADKKTGPEQPTETITTYRCQNCQRVYFSEDELITPVPDLEMRVAAGETMPAGECQECGAVVHLVK